MRKRSLEKRFVTHCPNSKARVTTLCDRVYATGQPFVGSDLSNGSGYPLALKRALPGSMR